MASVGRNEPCPCGSGRKFKKCHGAPVNSQQDAAVPPGGASGLFGPRAAYLVSLLDSFAKAAQSRSYRIMPLAESATIHDLAERNKIYWQEILYRAHFGACAGLMRLREWLHGSERALSDGNVLMLAAGIRGFLEAAADTWQGFADVAPTLAESHVVVRRAINGQLAEQMALAPELESMLIHFAYARKLKVGEGPALHNAATARDTVSCLLESAPAAVEVYGILCEYSHPAAPSVFRFAGDITHPDTVTFDPAAGPEKIREIVGLSQEVGRAALVLGVAPLVVALKVLNAFSFPAVATPWADGVELPFSDMWRDLERRLRDPAGPKTASDAERERLIVEVNAQYEPFGQGKRRKKT